MFKVKTSARRHWRAINGEVLNGDGKSLTVDEETLKGNEMALLKKTMKKQSKGNKKAY